MQDKCKLVFGLVGILGLFALLWAKDLSVEMSTVLGIKKTGTIYPYSDLEVVLFENETAVIPLNVISSVTLSGKMHSIETTWGEVFRGRCTGNLSITADGEQRDYSLNSINSLKILSHVEGQDYSYRQPSKVRWMVTGVKSSELKGRLLKDLGFRGSYYSRAGYIMGGETHVSRAENLYIEFKDEKILLQLADFKKFQLKNTSPNEYSENWTLTLYPPEGAPVSGRLVLEVDDSAGEHELSDWTVAGFDENKVEYRFIQDNLEFVQQIVSEP
jgi:hypothetical protein